MTIPPTLLVKLTSGLAGACVLGAAMADRQETLVHPVPASEEWGGLPEVYRVAEPVQVIEPVAPTAPAPTGVEQLRRVSPEEAEAHQRNWTPPEPEPSIFEWDNCPGCGMG